MMQYFRKNPSLCLYHVLLQYQGLYVSCNAFIPKLDNMLKYCVRGREKDIFQVYNKSNLI
jgi:hypothetical protein